MNIEIYQQPDDNTMDPENCIFCNEGTIYWNEETNRPVCPLCSVTNTVADIDNAPYNY